MAGVQGGFLVAGAVVGFVYNHIGLGGVLIIDACTYIFSFSCYLFVRRGVHVVAPVEAAHTHADDEVRRYFHDMRQGFGYLKRNRSFIAFGICWSLFLSAMMSQGVITAPLSDRILHAGPVGFGWLNMGWGIGAFLSATFATKFILSKGADFVIRVAMAFLSLGLFAAPFSRWLALAVLNWWVLGTARGIAGIAIGGEFMERVPKHLMGRVQNIFYFIGTALQLVISLCIGALAHSVSLTLAFFAVASIYGLAFLMALAPQPARSRPAAA
jgi:DHA3 family macrolide efflux protein-like MFS transporter